MKQARMLLQDLKQADLDAYRPIPFWSWNDKLQPQELRRQIRCMKQKHMGGFFMHARGGLETEYLSGEWFDAVKTSLEEAKAQNMGAWCYDENGWPSGFAGGELLKEEKNYAHYLRFAKKPEFEAEALAVYILQENKLRRVTCACPQAREYLCVYDCRNPSNVDILNPEITRAFLQLTHEKYYEHFKGEFGKTLKGFFTDEPQYFRYETAYTPVMLTAYHAAYGRDLLEMLGALFVDCEGARAFRFRYWRMMNALYCENFIGIIYQWCNQHNCMLTGHTIEESQMADQMWCCAGVMPFYEYEHIPGIDWLGREIGTELAPRQVSSVAQQLGKPQVLTETFACVGWDVTPKELKRIAEWQYVNGVNLMCQHLYPYSIRGQRKRDYPAFYSEHNPWTEELATFNDYFTKLGYLLSQSQEAADVLILHPIHSAYLTYNRQTDYESIRALSDNFNALIERFGAAGIVHHYGDERLMEKYAVCKEGTLAIGACSYHYVVVPECESLDSSTVALLKRYLSQGGKLWLAGEAPDCMNGERTDLSFLKSTITYQELQQQKGLFTEAHSEVRATLRHSSKGSFFYAVNLSQTSAAKVTARLPFQGAVQCDISSDALLRVPYRREQGEIFLSFPLEAGESRIFVEDDALPIEEKKEKEAVTVDLLNREWEIVDYKENSLALDVAALSFDGENYTEDRPVMEISEALLRGRKNRTVWLKYHFDAKYLPETLWLEMETAEKMQVSANGVALEASKRGVLDPAFVRASIADLIHRGNNEIVMRLDYIQPEEGYEVFNDFYYGDGEVTESRINCLTFHTNIEAVYLFGAFAVQPAQAYETGANNTLLARDFSIRAPIDKISPFSITAQGFPFFHGSMRLKTTVMLENTRWRLRCEGRYQYARIWVNDQKASLLLLEDVCDISGFLREGENVLAIDWMSSNRNLLGPFHTKGNPEPMSVDPELFTLYGTWKNAKSERYAEDYAFVSFGARLLCLESF